MLSILISSVQITLAQHRSSKPSAMATPMSLKSSCELVVCGLDLYIAIAPVFTPILGANPFNASNKGGPEGYTTDETILRILAEARDTFGVTHPASSDVSNPAPAPETSLGQYPMVPQFDPSQAYYRPMPLQGAAPGDQPQHPLSFAPGYYVTEGGYFVVPPPPMPMDYPRAQYRGGEPRPSPDVTKSIPCR
jgi:hypothetical protein